MSPQTQEETLSIPAPAPIDCPACGTGNTPDSKFCRHCGQLLRAPEARAKLPDPVAEANGDGDDARTSPQEIDARRARQLLDRALQMGERGEFGPAILACRQASTLEPNNPASLSMLGTLLERSGDVRGAVTAYERVLSLTPDSVLERESLARLRARLERAPAFHFNPDELFADEQVLPAADEVAVAPLGAEAVAVAPLAVESVAGDEPRPAIEARLPPTSAQPSAGEVEGTEAPVEGMGLSAYAPTVSSAMMAQTSEEVDPFARALAEKEGTGGAGKPAVSGLAEALHPETLEVIGDPALVDNAIKIERREGSRRQVAVPVATDQRRDERRTPVGASASVWAPVSRAATPNVFDFAPGTATPAPSTVLPLDFGMPATPAPRPAPWTHLLRGSSFFARTLPLVGVGVLGLGFLSWARSQAVSREVNRVAGAPTLAAAPTENGTTTQVVVPAQTTDVATTSVPVTVANTGSPVPVSNAPTTPATANAPGGAPVPSNGARPVPRTGTGAAPRTGSGTGTGTTPRTGTGTAPRTAAAPRPLPAAARPIAPVFPRVVSVPPAPVAPPAAPSTPSTSGGNIILPPPRVDVPQPEAPPIQVGSSLSPAGSPRQNTINITRSEIIRVAPPRTGSAARSEERDAAAATRAGQSDRAINSLTNAIGATGGDAGYLYQQRAMAFMQRGDSARATEDFQASINAYQDQINRGENVAAAQAGLRAARSGLAVAQANR